ncbi:MAG TPA: Gfo/Idh/MocA family oxidoreductase [Candidatus Acidoferrum sp.]|jgi:predicted dehydrogenase|nr:Gfo/Idh/MocA family oxidoreductase [Candidatus Acidoferrum sp.]
MPLGQTSAAPAPLPDQPFVVRQSDVVRIGVVGYGYWGPNIVRNFLRQESARVVSVCDKSVSSLERLRRDHPAIPATTNYRAMLADDAIDAIAVVTPVWTHFEIAKAALENGKHIFVEKPFTSTVEQGEYLIELAERKNLKIMVDHTFLFTGAVQRIRQLVDEGTLGHLYYYDSTRVNLGLFQHDVNVIWDLAPHDLSIMDYIIGKQPEALVATGECHLNGHADVAYLTVYYPDNLIGHISVNWLSPVKVRTTLLGGEKKMLVWNDLEADEKLKIYDRGIQVSGGEAVYQQLVKYRTGDMWSPNVEQVEALKLEASYFVECIRGDKRPFNDGMAGLRVVRMLESADRSLREKGRVVTL